MPSKVQWVTLCTLCTSRFVLGKEGTPIIGIEKDHELITKGPYDLVRHPIYRGKFRPRGD